MKKNWIFFFALVIISINTYSQQTIGLFLNTPESFDGYTLFGPQDSEETYLIDNCGEKVHSWNSLYKPGLSSYLLEDGTLLRTGRIMGMGGGSGVVELLDWNSNVIWSHSVSGTHGRQHHDIELLPNGNILLIVWDQRSQAEVSQAGSSTSKTYINSEQIIEIKPDTVNGGATVVWEWKAWDHLIQESDSLMDNYGVISERPERIDINFLNHNKTDWLHFNGIDYHEEFDQIIISVHNFSEFWIIDHSTTTAEAADSVGGTFMKGGDILYRWGNPQAYDQGNASDQKLFLQHHTHWIPGGYKDEGKIIVFNNQVGSNPDFSTINIIALPVDPNGFYSYNGSSFAPSNFDWTYQSQTPADFFSNILSGAERLENGNTLICEGISGRFFEIDSNSNIVWEYINPVNDLGPMAQSTTPSSNNVFRCTRYAPSYPGLNGQTLIPQGYIESGSTFSCNLYPAGVTADCNTADIYANDSTSAYCFDTIGNIRKCYTNDIPSHTSGPFGGNGAIVGQEFDYSMCLYPELDTIITYLFEDTTLQGCGGGIIYGVSDLGINYSPFAKLYFVNPNTLAENLNFHEEAVNTLNMDLNGGHVNVLGRYHYHSSPVDYIVNDLNVTGNQHSPLLGYAADGFPIYYKYLYSNAMSSNSAILSFQSSYSLKNGNRPGDGITAPGGTYDGTYYEDYEYIPLQSELDECGGRYGITPEYPNGTYYYVLTDNWPYIPRCFKGKFPDNSFRIGPNCPASNASTDCNSSPIVSVDVIQVQTQIELNVYPNPASTLLKLNIENDLSNKVTSLVIYNSNAQIIHSSPSFEETIQIGSLPKGIYFIQLDFDNDQITKKVIIQ